MPLLRRRLASLALVAVLLLASVWVWVGTADEVGAWQRGRALDERGVDVAATVLDYSYDSNGGDPGGWTTDTVRFKTVTGVSITAVVGHHDPGPEAHSKILEVTYDPTRPGIVRAAHYIDDADDPTNSIVGACLALALSVTTIVLGLRARRPATS